MPTIDKDTTKLIEEKARLYDETKKGVKASIKKRINEAKESLNTIEKRLIDEVNEKFGENPFSDFLSICKFRWKRNER